MSIRLPKIPTGDQHEDYVAAVLLGLGYFIETNLTLKEETTDVLELDVMATPSGPEFAKRKLMEAKTSAWSFGDLFKVYGWMMYLGVTDGCVAYRDDPDKDRLKAFEKVSSATGVRCCSASGKTDVEALAKSATNVPPKLFTPIVGTAWFCRIAQRVCLRKFLDRHKSMKDSDLLGKAREYQWALQQAFFVKKPISRVNRLYEAFKAAPHLSGALAEEYAGAKKIEAKGVWSKARDTSELLWLQHVMMMEHTARLGIIRNALDHISATEKDEAGQKINWDKVMESLAPQAFRGGLQTLRKHPHRFRIPFLFQVFAEVFGGFYRTDSDDLADIAAITGIPQKDVVPCLNLFDEFFPTNGGWFFEVKDLRLVKMVPAIYRGAGAFYRQDRHSLKAYDTYSPQMGWLISKWHNAIYECLEPLLAVSKDK